MDRSPRSRRDLLQNIAIVLLSVSAVLLFAQTQLYSLETGTSYFGHLMNSSVSGQPVPEAAALSAPVRAVVSGPYGRYGSVTLTTDQEAFAPFAALFRQAMGSARPPAACGEEEFWQALSRPSLYCDFLAPLPLSVLAETLGADAGRDDLTARQLAVSLLGDDLVQLYLRDGSGQILRCDTAVPGQDLTDLINRYDLGNASFAGELAELDSAYEQAAPWSLFLSPLPQLPVLNASAPSADTDRLLAAMDFSIHTNSRYLESSGTEVITEGARTLRLLPDGTVRYQSGGEAVAALELPHAGETITQAEAAAGAGALLGRLLGDAGGDAALYLLGVQRAGDVTTLRFDYQCGGIPIRSTDGLAAGEVTVTGCDVTALTLRLCQYTTSSQRTSLLPLRQTLAIAAELPGSELSVGYADDGGEQLRAGWFSD